MKSVFVPNNVTALNLIIGDPRCDESTILLNHGENYK